RSGKGCLGEAGEGGERGRRGGGIRRGRRFGGPALSGGLRGPGDSARRPRGPSREGTRGRTLFPLPVFSGSVLSPGKQDRPGGDGEASCRAVGSALRQGFGRA